MKHFITGAEYSLDTLQQLIDLAISYKKTNTLNDAAGKILTLIFGNPSLRTHLSFESGMKKLGGAVNVLNAADSWKFEYEDAVVMDGAKQEHIKDAARVISQYTDLIALRQSELITTAGQHAQISSWETLRKDHPIQQLAKYATKPVINMESNLFHPCQSMADMMTMQEHLGSVAKKKVVLTWVPHPKALPLATPHSQLLTPACFGMDVTVVHPEGFELDDEVIALAKEKAQAAGGSLTVSHDQNEALNGAEVVIAKSWASLSYFGDWEKERIHRQQFADWILTREKMALTANAFFMHCLPVRRNVEVTDAVLDSAQSLIIPTAENRMWFQMALTSYLLNNHE
jgi:N-acetylornithine carbamoyltransferase